MPACAPADTPTRNNTAGWDFAAAPKTTDHNTDNDASPPSPCIRSRASNRVWPLRSQHGLPCQNGRHPVRYIRTGGILSLASVGSVSISGKAPSKGNARGCVQHGQKPPQRMPIVHNEHFLQVARYRLFARGRSRAEVPSSADGRLRSATKTSPGVRQWGAPVRVKKRD